MITIANITGFYKGNCYIYFPLLFELNKQNPNIVYKDKNTSVGNRLLIEIKEKKYIVLKNYGDYNDRSKDYEIIMDIWNLNIDKTNNYFNNYYYTQNKSLYTKPFQDLTELFTFNIDPNDSTDFDDAISFDIETNTLYIHIVDIHSQIDINSDIDKNALLQSFTLYLPNGKQNMFPNEYADNKLSLLKNEKRKVITLEFKLNENNFDSFEIYQSLIIIKKRYNYIDSLPENLHCDNDSCLLTLYTLLNVNNHHNNLYLPSLDYKIDKDGKLVDIDNKSCNSISHKLIEKCMIISNSIVSKIVGIQRYHESTDIVDFQTDNTTLSSFMKVVQYKQAKYDFNEKGHFGLGLSSYTHFTSPIRRYFDIINHRILGGVVYNSEFLQKYMEYSNNRDKLSNQLVNLYKKWKLFDNTSYLTLQQYKGFITSINSAGIMYLIPEIMFTGFIHISNILDYKWIYNKSDNMWVTNKNTYIKQGFEIIIEITDINKLKQIVKSKIVKIQSV